MLGSVIRQMKLKFPFLNCRKTYESVCPEHCSSHSPAKLPERGQHPTTPTNLFHRAAVLLCQQFLYHLWGNPRGETEENPTLGCPMLSLCALGQPCWARQSWGFRGLMPCQGSQAVQGSATRAGLIRQIWAAQGFRRKGRRGKQPGAGRCGLGRDEVSDGSCFVLLLHLSTLGFGIFRLLRSMQQLLWPDWLLWLWAEMILLRPGWRVTGPSSHHPGPSGLPLFLLQKQLCCSGGRKGAGQGEIDPSGLSSAPGISRVKLFSGGIRF